MRLDPEVAGWHHPASGSHDRADLMIPDDEHEPDSVEPSVDAPSRAERREEAQAYRELAQRLSKVDPSTLPHDPFDEALRSEIADVARFTKNARVRQLRRLAQQLHQTAPVDVLVRALEGRSEASIAAAIEERENEAWREQLLTGGDESLSRFLQQYGDADRTRLRQLVRRATTTPTGVGTKKAATTLLREIRSLRKAEQDET